MPNGTYIECSYNEHDRCAEKEGYREKEMEKFAIKVSINPELGLLFCGQEYNPGFFTECREMTSAQLRTIERYCVTFGKRPPDDFLKEEGFDVSMSTQAILQVLRTPC